MQRPPQPRRQPGRADHEQIEPREGPAQHRPGRGHGQRLEQHRGKAEGIERHAAKQQGGGEQGEGGEHGVGGADQGGAAILGRGARACRRWEARPGGVAGDGEG